MPFDGRFFEYLGAKSLGELADLSDAEVKGDRTVEIAGIASSDTAEAGMICFFDGRDRKAGAVSSTATACFVRESAAEHLPDGVIAVVVPYPRWAYILAGQAMFRLRDWDESGEAPQIHETATICPGAVVGAGAAIGERALIGPNAVIGPGVQIGHDTKIGPGASIRCALIGNHVNILAGAKIGEAGFGVAESPLGAADIPQWGRVIVQDYVTIGANTCVDRGALTDTVIGERSKIDNLCQIAHNVIIGRNVLIASFTGISGTVTVGDGVIMGGRVGIADHVNIGEGAQLAASAGIFRDIPAGERWAGVPAKPLRQYFREVSWLEKQVSKPRSKDS